MSNHASYIKYLDEKREDIGDDKNLCHFVRFDEQVPFTLQPQDKASE
jgi:hypothetical protein